MRRPETSKIEVVYASLEDESVKCLDNFCSRRMDAVFRIHIH